MGIIYKYLIPCDYFDGVQINRLIKIPGKFSRKGSDFPILFQ